MFCSCHVSCQCVTWLGASQAEGHGAAERNGSGSKSLSAIVEYGSGDSSKYLASLRLTAKHGPWQERTRLWTPSLQTQSGRLLQPSRTGSWRGSEPQQENAALFPLQWLDTPRETIQERAEVQSEAVGWGGKPRTVSQTAIGSWRMSATTVDQVCADS